MEEEHAEDDDRRSALDYAFLFVGIAVGVLVMRRADQHMPWILAAIIGIAVGMLVASGLGSFARRWPGRA